MGVSSDRDAARSRATTQPRRRDRVLALRVVPRASFGLRRLAWWRIAVVMLATVLGILGGAAEIVVSGVWFWLVARVKVPSDRRPFVVAHAMTLGLGVAALALGAHGLGVALAWVATLGGGSFLALQTQSAQARKTPAVVVGGPVIDFTLPDSAGWPFDLASLRGTPFLLKFFRGHW